MVSTRGCGLRGGGSNPLGQTKGEEMPLYEYTCKECGNTVELIQKHDDTDVPVCEECKKEMEKVQICKTSFVLKGGCWEKDGYKK